MSNNHCMVREDGRKEYLFTLCSKVIFYILVIYFCYLKLKWLIMNKKETILHECMNIKH